MAGSGSGPLFLLRISKQWRTREGEEYDLLAGFGANVVVQADNFNPGDFFHRRLHDGASGFDELGAYLFEKVPTPLGGVRIGELLLGCGQDAAQPNDKEVANQVSPDILGAAAHEFLFEAADSVAYRGFDFALCFHGAPGDKFNRSDYLTSRVSP